MAHHVLTSVVLWVALSQIKYCNFALNGTNITTAANFFFLVFVTATVIHQHIYQLTLTAISSRDNGCLACFFLCVGHTAATTSVSCSYLLKTLAYRYVVPYIYYILLRSQDGNDHCSTLNFLTVMSTPSRYLQYNAFCHTYGSIQIETQQWTQTKQV